MQNLTRVITGFLVGAILAVWALAQPTTVSTITLDRPVHFTASGRTEIEVVGGVYRLESAGESRFRLMPVAGEPALVIQATATTHTETLESPVALTVLVFLVSAAHAGSRRLTHGSTVVRLAHAMEQRANNVMYMDSSLPKMCGFG